MKEPMLELNLIWLIETVEEFMKHEEFAFGHESALHSGNSEAATNSDPIQKYLNASFWHRWQDVSLLAYIDLVPYTVSRQNHQRQ